MSEDGLTDHERVIGCTISESIPEIKEAKEIIREKNFTTFSSTDSIPPMSKMKDIFNVKGDLKKDDKN